MTANASTTRVLLLRGINVNPSTRVSMAQLRDILTGLGFENVNTILQSGNVLADLAMAPDVPAVESAIASGTGVKSRVVALTVPEFRKLVEANPLLGAGDDLSRMVITFLDDDIKPSDIERPSDSELDPERLEIRPRAIYQWVPLGVTKSKLKPSWWRQFGPVATTRNVRTANRILEQADGRAT